MTVREMAFPAPGQIWADPLGALYEVHVVTAGEAVCRKAIYRVVVALELLRAGTGWTLKYDPQQYGGRKSWEW